MPLNIRHQRWPVFGFLLFAFLVAGCEKQNTAANANLDPAAAETVRSFRVTLEQGKGVSTEDVQALRSVYDRYPNATLVRQLLKNAYVSRSDWDALELLLTDRPLNELPQDEKIMLGTLLVKVGKYPKAIDLLEPLSNDIPNVEVYALLGTSYFYLDRPAEAGVAFDKVWDEIVASKRFDEMTMRGIIFFRENKLDESLETLKRSHQIKPDHIATNNALSRVFARLGDTEQAEAFRKRTVEGQGALVQSQYAASRQVKNVYDIEVAWKEKRFAEVIRISTEMLPAANRDQKIVLYQYIYEANKGLGNQSSAESALKELKQLQQTQ